MLPRIPAAVSASRSIAAQSRPVTRLAAITASRPSLLPCHRSQPSLFFSRSMPLSTSTPRPSSSSSSSLPAVSPPLTTSLPSDSFQLLPETSKPGAAEDTLNDQQIKDVEAWWATRRYASIKRPYTAADVVSKRGSLQQSYPSSVMARKLWDLVQENLSKGEPLHTSMSLCPKLAPPSASPCSLDKKKKQNH